MTLDVVVMVAALVLGAHVVVDKIVRTSSFYAPCQECVDSDLFGVL